MTDVRDALTFNERQVFESVLGGRTTSRAAIAEATGLTPPTVSRLVSGLIEARLIEEAADRSGRPGQPRRVLSVRRGQAYSIGVNFIHGRLDLAIVDLCGEVVAVDSVKLEQITAEAVAELSADRAAAALGAHRIPAKRVVGAGFSLPGGFAQDGSVLMAHEFFPDLHGRVLAPIFSEALGLPCSMDTDGACATLGEFLYGAAVGYDTFFLVHLGHGVGGGAMIDRSLFRGAHGNASKPGVLFPYGAPRPSGQDLVESLRATGHQITDIADLSDVGDGAAPLIEAWLDRAAAQLAELGRVVTAFLDPEVIFVGGRLPERFNRAIAERLSATTLEGPSRGLPNAPFLPSSLGEHSGVLGAASLPVFRSFFSGSKTSAGNSYSNGRRRPSGESNSAG